MNIEKPTVGILTYRSNKKKYDEVLLVRNTRKANIPGYSWPGGLLDDATKTPVEMAVLELEEESGLRTIPEKLTLWEHGRDPYLSPSGIAYPLIMFLCTAFEGEIRPPKDPHEAVKDPQWVPISKLRSLERARRLAPRVEEFVFDGRKQLPKLG